MLNISKYLLGVFIGMSILGLSACHEDNKASSQNKNSAKVIKVGVVPGPYRLMIDKHLVPILKNQGIEVSFVEFTDYVQPDAALDGGDIDANLMQHQRYLDAMIENQKMNIIGVVNVPTLGLGLFSDKYTKLSSLPEGSKVGIPADAVNLARALGIAQDLGLIKLNTINSEQKASIADISDNPLKLEFVPMEAAQIARSLDSIDLGFVPGNYAYAAGLDYSKALGIEQVSEPIKNVVAVGKKDELGLGKILHDAVVSDVFVNSLNQDPIFDAFTRPQWWPQK